MADIISAAAKAAIDIATALASGLNNAAAKGMTTAEQRGWMRFGSGMGTHVANKYHLPIIAKVRPNTKQPAPFAMIPPEEFVNFGHGDNSSMISYITITAVDENGKEHELCEDLPKQAGYSVMLNEKGFVVDVKYGKIWQRA